MPWLMLSVIELTQPLGNSGGSAPSWDLYSSHAHQWACLSMGKTSVMHLISALMKEVAVLSVKTRKIYINNFNRTSDWRAQGPGCWSSRHLQTWIFQRNQIFKVKKGKTLLFCINSTTFVYSKRNKKILLKSSPITFLFWLQIIHYMILNKGINGTKSPLSWKSKIIC